MGIFSEQVWVLSHERHHACGVQAMGRCGTCGRAFCSSHRAGSRGTIPNWCTACEAAYLWEQGAPAREYGAAMRAAWERIHAAVATLRHAGSPGLQGRREAAGTRRRLFGEVSLWHDLEPAWPVGRFTWTHSTQVGPDTTWDSTYVEETGVISSVYIVNMTHSSSSEVSFSFEAAAMLSIALKMEALAKGLPPARSNI